MGELAQWAAILGLAAWATMDHYRRQAAAKALEEKQAARYARFRAKLAAADGGRALLRARLAQKAGD